MISLSGFLIANFKTGRALRTEALCRASHEPKIHQEQTKRNCTIVRVMGLGKAVRMAFEEVFDRIDMAYQTPHRIFDGDQFGEQVWSETTFTYYELPGYRSF